MKQCTKCGEAKTLDAFTPHKLSKDGRHTVCLVCRAEAHKLWRVANKEREREKRAQRHAMNLEAERDRNLRRSYGISLARYREIYAEQQGLCALCGVHRDPISVDTVMKSRAHICRNILVVDHNHGTGAVRGLLCHTCNAGLGMFKENPALLMGAVWYLKASTLGKEGEKDNGAA